MLICKTSFVVFEAWARSWDICLHDIFRIYLCGMIMIQEIQTYGWAVKLASKYYHPVTKTQHVHYWYLAETYGNQLWSTFFFWFLTCRVFIHTSRVSSNTLSWKRIPKRDVSPFAIKFVDFCCHHFSSQLHRDHLTNRLLENGGPLLWVDVFPIKHGEFSIAMRGMFICWEGPLKATLVAS